jgi:short-subunit dehydrogenase
MAENETGSGEFKDKVVIITGASSGIGRELALQLAKEGAWLSLAARDGERLRLVAKECHECRARVMIIPTDVGQEEQCKRLIDDTVQEYGRLDVLINNAGSGVKGHFEEYPDLKLFKSLLAVNFFGSVYCTYYALPHLKKSKGRIVAVSSLLGKFTLPGNTAYSASKFAMAGFFDSLRFELRESGVSVTTVYPGLVITEFAERMLKLDGTPQGQQVKPSYAPGIMKAGTCARIIINAAAGRKRQVVMTFYGVIGNWLNQLFPSLAEFVFRLAYRLYHRDVAELE